MSRLFSFLVCALVGLAAAEQVKYDGYKVLRAEVATVEQAKFLETLDFKFRIWNNVRVGSTVDIMASPESLEELKSTLAARQMPFFVMVDDVQTLFDEEAEAIAVRKTAFAKANPSGKAIDLENYHSLDEIYAWFDELEGRPEVETEVIGQSTMGEDIRVLKLCTDGCNDQKPAMFIDAGIHAREWIAPATALWMINELTENLSDSNRELVDKLDWYFVASVNPDGYAYSQSNDRMWRKTRSNYGTTCTGTDANRNYAYQWNTGGTSDSPCSETYHGPGPLSEPEALAIDNFIADHPQIKFYNDLHSYSEVVLFPWGYSQDLIPDFRDVQDVGDKGNEALEAVHGKNYEVGPIAVVLYVASGSAVDNSYGSHNIKYSYTIELRDKGLYGFVLPPSQIRPTGEEIFAFHESAARDIIAEYA